MGEVDEEARRERLKLLMIQKIAMEEKQEVVRVNIEIRKRVFLERAAAEKKLRRAEMKEMRRLRQENMDRVRNVRQAKIQERREHFERFCAALKDIER